MRWLFLLLLMLNGFYYVWHQQEAPLRAKEVLPLALNRADRQHIQLLSETNGSDAQESGNSETQKKCLYLGGFSGRNEASVVGQRLLSLDVQSQVVMLTIDGQSTYWAKIDPPSRRLVEASLVRNLGVDFPELKDEIMLCEGIATVGQFE
jgi:hypothetical protein